MGETVLLVNEARRLADTDVGEQPWTRALAESVQNAGDEDLGVMIVARAVLQVAADRETERRAEEERRRREEERKQQEAARRKRKEERQQRKSAWSRIMARLAIWVGGFFVLVIGGFGGWFATMGVELGTFGLRLILGPTGVGILLLTFGYWLNRSAAMDVTPGVCYMGVTVFIFCVAVSIYIVFQGTDQYGLPFAFRMSLYPAVLASLLILIGRRVDKAVKIEKQKHSDN